MYLEQALDALRPEIGQKGKKVKGIWLFDYYLSVVRKPSSCIAYIFLLYSSGLV